MMESFRTYNFRSTLTFGDVYGQIFAWVLVIFFSLATGFGLIGTNRPLFGILAILLILVLSFPLLLFAFTTTLINHIELSPE